MPYIVPQMRAALNLLLRPFLRSSALQASAAGDLNFVLTSVILAWLGPTPGYGRFNEAIGALECAKLELYRRAIAPYEDTKIAQNGDVY